MLRTLVIGVVLGIFIVGACLFAYFWRWPSR